MNKVPWIGITTVCCSFLAAAVMGMLIGRTASMWLFFAWLFCSAMVCAGELVGKAVGKKRRSRYGGNVGAGIACAVLLVFMLIVIFIDLSSAPTGGFIDLRGLAALLALLGIGAPVIASVIANAVSIVIKRKNRSTSPSSPRKRLRQLNFRPFLPPLIGLGACLALTVVFRLFVRVEWSLYALEIIFSASEICLTLMIGMILNRVFGVNFMDNLLIFLPQANAIWGLISGIGILEGDTELNTSYIEKAITVNRVFIALHVVIILADIAWLTFKLKRDKGFKPKNIV